MLWRTWTLIFDKDLRITSQRFRVDEGGIRISVVDTKGRTVHVDKLSIKRAQYNCANFQATRTRMQQSGNRIELLLYLFYEYFHDL